MHARYTTRNRFSLWVAGAAILIAAAKVAGIDAHLPLEQLETFGITIFLLLVARVCISAATDHNENLHKPSLLQSIANAVIEALAYTAALAVGWAILRLLPF